MQQLHKRMDRQLCTVEVFCIKVGLKHSYNPQEISFADLLCAALSKRRVRQRCFPESFSEKTILLNTCKRLLMCFPGVAGPQEVDGPYF